MCESWRKVWREGFVPQLSTQGLQALKKALETNDERLIQGATTTPPSMECVQDWPVEAACALGYCGVADLGGFAEEGPTVADVEDAFANLCYQADQILGEPAACRYFLNWFDETPRDEMRRELLIEVELALSQREDQPVIVGGDNHAA